MEFKAATCPSCGGALEVRSLQRVVICKYCGKSVVIHSSHNSAASINQENLLVLANTALEAKNWAEAYRYYTKFLESDSSNSSAWLGKAQAAGKLSTQDDSQLEAMVVSLRKAVQFANPADASIRSAASALINEVGMNLFGLLEKIRVEDIEGWYSPGPASELLQPVWEQYLTACGRLTQAFEAAHEMDPSDSLSLENAIRVCQRNLTEHKVPVLTTDQKARLESKLFKYTEQVRVQNPAYTPPSTPTQTKDRTCFVASAVLGSEHPDVMALRQFRDDIMLRRHWGKVSVALYYRYGPALANLVSQNIILRMLATWLLVRPAAAFVRILAPPK